MTGVCYKVPSSLTESVTTCHLLIINFIIIHRQIRKLRKLRRGGRKTNRTVRVYKKECVSSSPTPFASFAMLILSFILISLISRHSEAFNVLVYSPSFGGSHTNFMARLADTLTEAGHRVVGLNRERGGEEWNYSDIPGSCC